MRTSTSRRFGLGSVAVAAVLLSVAACGNVYEGSDPNKSGNNNAGGPSGGTTPGGAPDDGTGAYDLAKLTQKNPSTQPGVTDSTIKVGGVAATTNILKLPIDQAFNGTQAYFDMINSKGGIWGRKIELTSKRDDQMMKNKEEAQGLISQDGVFAAAPVATFLFTGAGVFGDDGIPTFGWNISPDWAGPENLFGDKGSFICTTCAYPTQPFVAREVGAKKVALLAYGVDQSAQCAAGVKKSFETWPTAEIVYTDDTIPYGNTDYGVQVQKIREAGVQMILTCMDQGGVINVAREVKKQGTQIPQYIQQGYDYDLVSTYGPEFEGSIVLTQFTPLEVSQPPQGIKDYLEWIAKVPGAQKGEISMSGWLNADLLVRGIALAGPDFTQESVVAAINRITNWTANGIAPGWDWTRVHEEDMPLACLGFSKITGGKFEPIWGEPGKPFVCLKKDDKEIPASPPRQAGVKG